VPKGHRRPLDRWSRFDPTGVVAQFVRVARQVPGVELAEDEYAKAERALLREVKQLLDEAAEPGPSGPTDDFDAAPAPYSPEGLSPAERMSALLRRSMDQSPQDSRRSLLELLLGEITPDEARILSALSDGSAYALVHIGVAGLPGSRAERVLSNASSVGRAAGVALPEHTATYVTHLRGLGLVHSDPEDPSLGDEYEILLTDSVVREALLAAGGAGRLGSRVLRRVLRISPLGLELWSGCQPGASPESAG
jgi:hypothetical protein